MHSRKNDPSPLKPSSDNPTSNRMPRGAIATVIVGLVFTMAIVAVDIRTEGSGTSESTEWLTVEKVETPDPVKLGKGASFGLARTTLAAIAPIESGELLFRVAGAVEIDSGNRKGPATVRCDVNSPSEDSFIARTPKRRAAWPRPSVELQAQPVPDELVVKFKLQGNEILGLPVRDSFRTFTDSAAPTDVDWDGFADRTQNWVWTMPEGTGEGGATLTWLVIFKSTEKPRAKVLCSGTAGGETARVRLEAVQQEWPLVDPNADTAEAGTDVE